MKGSTAIGILAGTSAAAALTASAAVRIFPDAHPMVGLIIGAAWGAIGLVLLEVYKRRNRGK